MIPRGMALEQELPGESYCLFAEKIKSVSRPVVCNLMMARVERFHCVVLIKVRCTVTFSFRIKIIAFMDGFFDWLVLLNSVHIYSRC